MNESKRFMVHAKSLADQDFVEFLCKSAEEYGFYNDGILKIPYEAEALIWGMDLCSRCQAQCFEGTLIRPTYIVIIGLIISLHTTSIVSFFNSIK